MKWRTAVKWLLFGVLAITVVALYEIVPNFSQRLPDPTKVRRMTAKLFPHEPKNLREVPEFEVQAEDTPIILHSLEPKYIDFMDTTQWVVHGVLNIETVDGSEIQVYLFWTDEETSAFAVGSRRRQCYYRGGNDLAIDKAVRNAYAKAKVAAKKGSQE
ncbi:MAG TPA: hypothetical protein VKS79_19380 [Gemmataceae bacterium]|nr:hypothetical protein [Gemmataceae bacterium]